MAARRCSAPRFGGWSATATAHGGVDRSRFRPGLNGRETVQRTLTLTMVGNSDSAKMASNSDGARWRGPARASTLAQMAARWCSAPGLLEDGQQQRRRTAARARSCFSPGLNDRETVQRALIVSNSDGARRRRHARASVLALVAARRYSALRFGGWSATATTYGV